jgi:hypothetical protein
VSGLFKEPAGQWTKQLIEFDKMSRDEGCHNIRPNSKRELP